MISSSSSPSDRTQDDAPRRFCALGRHQLFPRCCLLGQPVSRRGRSVETHGRLAQNRALPLSKDDSCAPCLSPGNRGGEEGSAGGHNPCKKMAEDLFRVASPRIPRWRADACSHGKYRPPDKGGSSESSKSSAAP